MIAEFPVSHDVEYEIIRLLRRSRARGMRMVDQIHPDLEYADYLILIAVHESHDPGRAGVRGSELAETVGVHKSTVSRALSSLARLGLVERVPDPTDGRARLVAVTEGASQAVEAVRDKRHEQLAEALSDWSREDLGSLAGLLQRLNTALD